jgi:putative nucleotidyltransferase with HDIG domain
MIKLLKKINLKVTAFALCALAYSFIAGVTLILPLFLFFLYAYAKARNLIRKNCTPLNLALLFLVAFVSGYFISINRMPAYFITFSLASMIATLIFSSIEVSLLVTLAVAVSVAAFSRQPMQLIIMYLSSSILAAKLSQGARKRTTIIQAGIAIGVIQAVIAALTSPAAKNFPIELLYFFINGVASSVILLGILPIFEYLFKGLTNISLLELADFHHPLLELLIQDAPGTYHHSLIVGNLSESAAKAIGANSLLTRVGAYYHDVGKLLKPQYFSENQDKNGSRHEGLSAAMSKLVIMNHVKEGAELARRYRLNPVLIDFIEQHHGKSLVYYFYRRALESPEEDQEVKEEGFRYPGPKPDSKETAIVLLADSVEAAARAANNPDSAKIEGLVHKVINNKFIDGQLDECELTLKDLEKISAIFTKLLCGIYHSRANYPEKTGDA